MYKKEKRCELCSGSARMFCESDEASLCWDCDEKVHAANFLVAKHSRTLLCHLCQSHTPWNAAGPKLHPIISLCHACACSSSSSTHQPAAATAAALEDVCSDQEDTTFETSTDDSNSDDDDDDDSDDENQVVPWSSSPPSTRTTHQNVSSYHSHDHEEDEDGCCSSHENYTNEPSIMSFLSSRPLKMPRRGH